MCAASVSGLGSFGALCGLEVVSRSVCVVWSVVSWTGVWSCTGSVGRGWGGIGYKLWEATLLPDFGGRVLSYCNFRIVLTIGLDVSV